MVKSWLNWGCLVAAKWLNVGTVMDWFYGLLLGMLRTNFPDCFGHVLVDAIDVYVGCPKAVQMDCFWTVLVAEIGLYVGCPRAV